MQSINRTQIKRTQGLLARLRNRTPGLGSPAIGGDRKALAAEVCRATHDVLGGLTATRVALGDASAVTLDGRDKYCEAEAAIIAAEHAVMRYREAVIAPHNIKPWEV